MTKFQPDYTRLINAIRRQGDPNYVPMLELFADPEIVSAVLNEPFISWDDQDDHPELALVAVAQRVRFWHSLGYDAIPEGPSMLFPGTLGQGTDDTAENPGRGQRRWVEEGSGIITSWQDFEAYPWPKPESFDFSTVEYALSHMPEGMGLVARGSGIFETATFLMGYETLATALYDQPDLVQAVFDRVGSITQSVNRAMVQMEGVIALFVGDDLGFRSGTMISPRHIRQYAIPFHKEAADLAHSAGMPYILHSCGKLDKIMDDLIAAGIDARHSYEDIIEPVESFAARFNDRIAVVGGLDIDLLARGSEEAVRARARQILEANAAGRAYVFGTGNSVVNYMPVSNYLAMLDECRKFNGVEL